MLSNYCDWRSQTYKYEVLNNNNKIKYGDTINNYIKYKIQMNKNLKLFGASFLVSFGISSYITTAFHILDYEPRK